MGQGKEGLSAGYIAEAAEASLKRLQTDVIDLYLSHWPDMATPYEETLGAYQRLTEEGKIRWCGASNLSAKMLEAALATSKAKGLPRYEVLQPEYNLADRQEFEGGLADLCEREQIGVITYFSLAKGFLSGKYRSEADLAKSARGGDGQGLPQSAGVSHPRCARRRRRSPQGQARGSRARLDHGEARRHGADRKRHLNRTGRQPRARDRALAEPRRHGRAQRGERAVKDRAAGHAAGFSIACAPSAPFIRQPAIRGAGSCRRWCAAAHRGTRYAAAACIRSDAGGSRRRDRPRSGPRPCARPRA